MIVPALLSGSYEGLPSASTWRKDLRYYAHDREPGSAVPARRGGPPTFVQASALGLGGEMVGGLVKAQERLTGSAWCGEP